MTTALQIIDRALEHIQIKAPGETTSAEDADLALRALIALLDAWRTYPQAVIGLTELTFTPTSGAQTVTIGPFGADITARPPVRIEAPSFVRVAGVDSRLTSLQSFEEYTAEAVKGTTGKPCQFFYMRGVSVGTLYLMPAADGATALHLWVRQEVIDGQSTIALADTLTLPPGYQMALEYALAVELCMSFTRPMAVTQAVSAMAGRWLRALKRSNFVSHQLETPLGVPAVVSTGYE